MYVVPCCNSLLLFILYTIYTTYLLYLTLIDWHLQTHWAFSVEWSSRAFRGTTLATLQSLGVGFCLSFSMEILDLRETLTSWDDPHGWTMSFIACSILTLVVWYWLYTYFLYFMACILSSLHFSPEDASFAGQGVVYETMQLAHVQDPSPSRFLPRRNLSIKSINQYCQARWCAQGIVLANTGP